MTSETIFKAGMYLLETLTSGMYNEPLSIYREYIQNAVDSIDQANHDAKASMVIDIMLDPINKTITIFDNGEGISAAQTEKTLSTIGSSEKIGTRQRGFRGIGRLGGVAFAEKVIFRTKAKGECVESIQEWNCKLLRSLLADLSRSSMTIEEVFDIVTSFKQEKSTILNEDSFFEVTLEGVKSFRSHIFDIAKIKEYLGQVAPLPFDPQNFSFATEITKFLSDNLDQYDEYNIRLNGNLIFRPYVDEVKVTNKGSCDLLQGVELVEFKVDGAPIAFGWYGKRRDLLGAISKGTGIGGVRVKAGNITIGDEHLLDKCYRENRFNSYIIGEIHVQSHELIPNSRRDDFIDNDMKNLFYNVLEKEIGLPLSREVRQRSRLGKNIDVAKKKVEVSGSESMAVKIGECELGCSTHSKVHQDNFIIKAVLNQCKMCPKLEQILQSSTSCSSINSGIGDRQIMSSPPKQVGGALRP